MSTYGKQLKRVLKSLGKTQKELSLKTDIPTSAISSYASDKYLPKDENEDRIFEVINDWNTLEQVLINPNWLTIEFIFKSGDKIKYTHGFSSNLDYFVRSIFNEVKYSFKITKVEKDDNIFIGRKVENFNYKKFDSFSSFYQFTLTILLRYILNRPNSDVEETYPLQCSIQSALGGFIGVITVFDDKLPDLSDFNIIQVVDWDF